MDNERRDKHESYGVLGFTRCYNGGSKQLFGSSIKHSNTICLTLKAAQRVRHLNNYSYFGKETLFEVEMSPTQFYDAIANMNVGDGVPVTIRYANGKRMENPPADEDVRQCFQREFREAIGEAAQDIRTAIAKVEELLESKKNFTKADKTAILRLLNEIERNIGGSTSRFILREFNEQMDSTIVEAKGEVEAFITNKIHAVGLEALKDELGSLISIEIEDTEE